MTSSTLVLIGAGVTCGFLVLLVTALFSHKKSASRQLKVIGASGVIEIQLNPVGAIIVNGELWRARLRDGTAAPRQSNVRVVGTQGHLLLVEPMSDKL